MFIWQTPPTWFSPLDQHERITARSSAQVAICGSQSETQIPLWPCCFHFRCEARSGERPSPIGVMTGLKLGGNGWPASRFTSGLGSNVSIWLGPPSMNRKITLRAVAVRRHEADATTGDGVVEADPAAASEASRSVKARAPNPAPAESSQSRRVSGVTRWGIGEFIVGASRESSRPNSFTAILMPSVASR